MPVDAPRMEVLNKLKNAVSSALPGNPLSKDFEVYGLIATAGPGHFWKIYNATKRTTKQVWVLILIVVNTLSVILNMYICNLTDLETRNKIRKRENTSFFLCGTFSLQVFIIQVFFCSNFGLE